MFMFARQSHSQTQYQKINRPKPTHVQNESAILTDTGVTIRGFAVNVEPLRHIVRIIHTVVL